MSSKPNDSRDQHWPAKGFDPLSSCCLHSTHFKPQGQEVIELHRQVSWVALGCVSKVSSLRPIGWIQCGLRRCGLWGVGDGGAVPLLFLQKSRWGCIWNGLFWSTGYYTNFSPESLFRSSSRERQQLLSRPWPKVREGGKQAFRLCLWWSGMTDGVVRLPSDQDKRSSSGLKNRSRTDVRIWVQIPSTCIKRWAWWWYL